MQGKFTFVKINEKICVLVKKIFQFGGVLFSQRDLFLAKSDLASTIPSNTMITGHIIFIFLNHAAIERIFFLDL